MQTYMHGAGPSEFAKLTSTPEWLAETAAGLQDVKGFNLRFSSAAIAHSTYSQTTQRVGATTLASFEAKGLMPLSLEIRPEVMQDELLRWTPSVLRISVGGAITVRHEMTLDPDASDVSPSDLINAYHASIKLLRGDVGVRANSFAELWSDLHPEMTVEFPHDGDLGEASLLYESLDFNFHVFDSNGLPVRKPIKSLISVENLELVRELAALSRMSPVEPSHYDRSRLDAFRDADIGNREDELWIINHNRMMRSHPDWWEERNKNFYEDSILLSEILLQQRASLDYLDGWLRSSKASLRRHAYSLESPAGSRGVADVVRDIERVTDHLADPTQLLLGVRNPFFREMAQRLASEMEVIAAGERAMQNITLFLGITRSLYSHSSAYDQSKEAERQRQIAADTRTIETDLRRMTRIQLVVTMVAALAAIAAVIISVIAIEQSQVVVVR